MLHSEATTRKLLLEILQDMGLNTDLYMYTPTDELAIIVHRLKFGVGNVVYCRTFIHPANKVLDIAFCTCGRLPMLADCDTAKYSFICVGTDCSHNSESKPSDDPVVAVGNWNGLIERIVNQN